MSRRARRNDSAPVPDEALEQTAELTDLPELPPEIPNPSTETAPGRPLLCGNLYRILGEIEAVAFAGLNKLPVEQCRAIFAYTDDEVNELEPVTAPVLEKYSSFWVREHSDELNLLFALLAIHQRKFGGIMALKRTVQPAGENADAGN